MKMQFIAINSQYIHSCLALQSLAELAKPYGEVLFREFTVNQDYRKVLGELAKADRYFFSSYIWNRDMVLRLMKDLKNLYPEAEIYVGGPEAQSTPQDFLAVCDGVFLGEGETPLIDFLSGLKPASLQKKEHVGIIHREDRLDWPYPFDLVDPTRIVYYESQRGCPYHCSYCLSAEVDVLVDAPMEKVKADLKCLVGMGAKLIKLTDRSFNAKPKRCLELLDFFGEFTEEVTFHVELSPYGLTPELIETISRLPKNRLQVEIGFQAIQPHVLKAIQRPAYSDRVLGLLEELMKLPLHRHIDLIAGLPGMSLQDVAETFDYLFSLEPDDLQMGFLKVLPGTPLGRQAKFLGLVSSANPPYEILKTPDISFAELNQLKQVEEVAAWFYPAAYPEAFRYLADQLESPFQFYLKLIGEDTLSEKSLENRLRLVQERLGDDMLKEYLEIDYRRQKRHRKHLFFADRKVGLREILDSELIEKILDRIPDLDVKKLDDRIALYRIQTDYQYALYDYRNNLTYYLGD